MGNFLMNQQTLHSRLTAIVTRAYFQPPASIKMDYPCVVYRLADTWDLNADNTNYLRMLRYDVVYITKSPADDNVLSLLNLEHTNLNSTYEKDNLYHYSYTIYN